MNIPLREGVVGVPPGGTLQVNIPGCLQPDLYEMTRLMDRLIA